jgi:anti-anti-sigma regulatory factor
MTTRITELERRDGGRTLLRVEGSLGAADVELLEEVCAASKARTGRDVMLDLAGVSFLDGAGASLLTRLRREQNVALKNLRFFIRQVIEVAERADANSSTDAPLADSPTGQP